MGPGRHCRPARNPAALHVFARHRLARGLEPDRPAVLLEGDWPEGSACDRRRSLDEAVDARHAWIDEAASRLATEVAERSRGGSDSDASPAGISVADLNALALRYYLVKLLRLIAYFQDIVPPGNRPVRAHLEAGRDEDYADVLQELSVVAGFPLRINWHGAQDAAAHVPPPNRVWRRLASALNRRLNAARCFPNERREEPHVLLCGHPGVLDPVCEALLDRGCRAAWLYDRFAVNSWRRWRARGVLQFNCDASQGRRNRFAEVASLGSLDVRGVNLARPVERWIRTRAREEGPGQSRLLEQVARHLEAWPATHLVLDEDATPLARAAVLVARRRGVTSAVVQHGAPYVRFGFAPPLADRLFVWGDAARDQLLRWDVEPARIRATGSPRHDQLIRCLQSQRPSRAPSGERRALRILLLATVPPRDERPDAVSFHLTTRTHEDLFRAACAAAAGLRSAELTVKLHPRSPGDAAFRRILGEFPHLSARLLRKGDLAELLRRHDCVLSCASSAGVEATLAGLPVIQLLPQGSDEILPAHAWGLSGTARSQCEIVTLLDRIADDCRAGRRQAPRSDVFANLDRPAAEQIANALLDDEARPCTTLHPCPARQPQPVSA